MSNWHFDALSQSVKQSVSGVYISKLKSSAQNIRDKLRKFQNGSRVKIGKTKEEKEKNIIN